MTLSAETAEQARIRPVLARAGDSVSPDVGGFERAGPETIMIEATVFETHIDIAMLCPGAETMQQAGDDIAEASYEWLMKLAVNCGCELRHVIRRKDPVRFVLRLDRDMA